MVLRAGSTRINIVELLTIGHGGRLGLINLLGDDVELRGTFRQVQVLKSGLFSSLLKVVLFLFLLKFEGGLRVKSWIIFSLVVPLVPVGKRSSQVIRPFILLLVLRGVDLYLLLLINRGQ